MNAEQEVHRAMQAALLLALMETAARLAICPGPVAASLQRDCWSTLADLELGCGCAEAAATLVSSAEKWLAAGSVAA